MAPYQREGRLLVLGEQLECLVGLEGGLGLGVCRADAGPFGEDLVEGDFVQ